MDYLTIAIHELSNISEVGIYNRNNNFLYL